MFLGNPLLVTLIVTKRGIAQYTVVLHPHTPIRNEGCRVLPSRPDAARTEEEGEGEPSSRPDTLMPRVGTEGAGRPPHALTQPERRRRGRVPSSRPDTARTEEGTEGLGLPVSLRPDTAETEKSRPLTP